MLFLNMKWQIPNKTKWPSSAHKWALTDMISQKGEGFFFVIFMSTVKKIVHQTNTWNSPRGILKVQSPLACINTSCQRYLTLQLCSFQAVQKPGWCFTVQLCPAGHIVMKLETSLNVACAPLSDKLGTTLYVFACLARVHGLYHPPSIFFLFPDPLSSCFLCNPPAPSDSVYGLILWIFTLCCTTVLVRLITSLSV